jgi:hypothetical protein
VLGIEGVMADAHAGNVGDGVERPRLAVADGDAQIS